MLGKIRKNLETGKDQEGGVREVKFLRKKINKAQTNT
jgi:hypothetical protein